MNSQNSQTASQQSKAPKSFHKHLIAGAVVVALGAGIGTWLGLEQSGGSSSDTTTTAATQVQPASDATTQDLASIALGVKPAPVAEIDYLTEASVMLGVPSARPAEVDYLTQARVMLGVPPAR